MGDAIFAAFHSKGGEALFEARFSKRKNSSGEQEKQTFCLKEIMS